MLTGSLYAQGSGAQYLEEQPQHEISLWGGYGLSTLKYDLSFGNRTPGCGGLIGIGYNYYLTYHWSVGLGLEYSMLSAKSEFPNFMDNYVIPGWENERPLNLEVSSSKYKQSYNVSYLNIPLIAQYQLDVWDEHKFYVAGGVKLGIPMSGKYKSEGDFFANAYERKTDGTNTGDAYGTNLKEKGFGSRTESSNKGTFDTKANVILTIEPGMKWRLNDKLALYTGVFLDYGLSDIRKNSDDSKSMIQHDVDSKGKFSGYTFSNALESQYSREAGNAKAFTDRVSTLSVGLKVRLGFAFGEPKDKKRDKKSEQLTAEDVDRIVSDNTQRIIDNQDKGLNYMAQNTQMIIDSQDKGFRDIKDLLNKHNEKEKQEVKEGRRLETVSAFELDETRVQTSMHDALQKNLEALRSNPAMKILLVGHTDDIGGVNYNMNLGKRRAESIKDWLVSQGINGSRITVESKGNTAPIVPNINDENRKFNRRVEFIIVK
jgi:outer membrane protein OmpA-like peptidoglycan-associated protein/opacity protein-like surface antigen